MSGVLVVLSTGTAVTLATAWHATTPVRIAIAVIFALTTVILALAVYRFASKNAEHIGHTDQGRSS